jgi:phosphoribosylamine---glycine ligase
MTVSQSVKVLVVGSGGREHAICWKLAASPLVSRLYCAPGNGGTASLQKTENVDLKVSDFKGIADFAQQCAIDLVVIGPDNPLADGIVDYLQERGLRVFGPRKNAALLEASKAFAKDFMKEHGVPTAPYLVADDYDSAVSLLPNNPWIKVVKADGLALGKGVFVCDTEADVKSALNAIFKEQRFGQAGSKVVLEERLTGEEISLLFFCDGKELAPMPTCQDHKRRFDGDRGPNTGGMGVYSPVPLYGKCKDEIETQVVQPLRKAFAQGGIHFQGVLYVGLLIVIEKTADGRTVYKPNVLEFNARFGDPETQVILPLLQSDLLPILWSCTDGSLGQCNIDWLDQSACCVVACADNYPEGSSSGKKIELGIPPSGVQVFHAGTKLQSGELVTAGGRVLAVTSVASTFESAVNLAYSGIKTISFEGVDYRTDIGRRAVGACP